MYSLPIIVTIGLLAWFWSDSLRTRELAIKLCRAACEREQVQLLDQTVVLSHLRPKRTWHGLRWRRVYRFDYSNGGVERYSGYLALIGKELEILNFGREQEMSGE